MFVNFPLLCSLRCFNSLTFTLVPLGPCSLFHAQHALCTLPYAHPHAAPRLYTNDSFDYPPGPKVGLVMRGLVCSVPTAQLRPADAPLGFLSAFPHPWQCSPPIFHLLLDYGLNEFCSRCNITQEQAPRAPTPPAPSSPPHCSAIRGNQKVLKTPQMPLCIGLLGAKYVAASFTVPSESPCWLPISARTTDSTAR